MIIISVLYQFNESLQLHYEFTQIHSNPAQSKISATHQLLRILWRTIPAQDLFELRGTVFFWREKTVHLINQSALNQTNWCNDWCNASERWLAEVRNPLAELIDDCRDDASMHLRCLPNPSTSSRIATSPLFSRWNLIKFLNAITYPYPLASRHSPIVSIFTSRLTH